MAGRSVRGTVLKARSPKKDPQREEVYRWENAGFYFLFYKQGMNIETAGKLVRSVCRYYKIAPPVLRTVYLGKKGFTADADALKIRLNGSKAKWTGPLLAHEIAHTICEARGIEEPDHGPIWLGIYLHILHRWHILPVCASVPSARSSGLKFRDPAKCGPEDL